MWRVLTKQHLKIHLHFLLPGHTKFAPDWWFGLLKQKFRHTEVSTLSELQDCVQQSTVNGLNQVQLAGPENGPADVPLIKWHTYIHCSASGICGTTFATFVQKMLRTSCVPVLLDQSLRRHVTQIRLHLHRRLRRQQHHRLHGGQQRNGGGRGRGGPRTEPVHGQSREEAVAQSGVTPMIQRWIVI